MNTSNIRLGSIIGIPIFVHSTTLWFLLLIGLLKGFELAIATVVVLTIVLLHELGHSIAARRYGIDVLKIAIYPFGGMAHMSMIPERPKEELIVALAGPGTNFLLAIPGLIFLGLTGNLGPLNHADPTIPPMSPMVALAWTWTWINLLLGGFNLLPAFPMDGGRVLRALLVNKLGYLGATEVAVRVGRWIAGAMLFWAIFGPGFGLGLFFVAVFVWLMGTRELFAVRMRTAAGFGASGDLHEVFSRMFSMGNRNTNPFARPPGAGPAPQPPRAPGEVEIVVEPKADQAGFSESDVRRLESFHGRLPRQQPPE